MKYVYRIYSAGRLHYVGKTGGPERRIAQHLALWLAGLSDVAVLWDGPHPEAVATVRERRAIMTENPVRNVQWKRPTPLDVENPRITASLATMYLDGRMAPLYDLIARLRSYGLEPVDTQGGNLLYRLADVENAYIASRMGVAA